jgi:hypothetical protein
MQLWHLFTLQIGSRFCVALHICLSCIRACTILRQYTSVVMTILDRFFWITLNGFIAKPICLLRSGLSFHAGGMGTGRIGTGQVFPGKISSPGRVR